MEEQKGLEGIIEDAPSARVEPTIAQKGVLYVVGGLAGVAIIGLCPPLAIAAIGYGAYHGIHKLYKHSIIEDKSLEYKHGEVRF